MHLQEIKKSTLSQLDDKRCYKMKLKVYHGIENHMKISYFY